MPLKVEVSFVENEDLPIFQYGESYICEDVHFAEGWVQLNTIDVHGEKYQLIINKDWIFEICVADIGSESEGPQPLEE
jgi:hypothetical protein